MSPTSSLLGAALLGLGLATAAPAQPSTYANPSHAKASEVPTIALHGQIVGPEGPLPGAIVTLKSAGYSAVTNSNGILTACFC